MRCTALLALTLLAPACQNAPPAPDHARASELLGQRQSRQVLELLKGDPSPEGERLKATAVLQLQDMDGAARHLDRAIAAGGSAAVFADYARLELIRGQLDRAAAMQAKAEQGGDNGMLTLLTGGEIALAQRQPARALTYFDRAAALYPDNLAVIGGRARALADLGQWGELAPLVTQLETKAPGDPDVAVLRKRLAVRR